MRAVKVHRACVFGRICGRMDDPAVEAKMEGGQVYSDIREKGHFKCLSNSRQKVS